MVKDGEGELITQTEAAKLRGMTVAAINMLVIRGRIRSKVLFGKRLVYKSDVLGYEPMARNKWSKRVTKKRGAKK
jgi:hypothetical protein